MATPTLERPAAVDYQPYDRVNTPNGEGIIYAIHGGMALVSYPQVSQFHPLADLAIVCRPLWREADGSWRHVSETHPGITYTLRETGGGGYSCTCPGNTYHGYCKHAVHVATVEEFLMGDDPEPEPTAPAPYPVAHGKAKARYEEREDGSGVIHYPDGTTAEATRPNTDPLPDGWDFDAPKRPAGLARAA